MCPAIAYRETRSKWITDIRSYQHTYNAHCSHGPAAAAAARGGSRGPCPPPSSPPSLRDRAAQRHRHRHRQQYQGFRRRVQAPFVGACVDGGCVVRVRFRGRNVDYTPRSDPYVRKPQALDRLLGRKGGAGSSEPQVHTFQSVAACSPGSDPTHTPHRCVTTAQRDAKGTVVATPGQAFVTGLLSGAVAGITVDLTLFPLDTIKTRLQVGFLLWPALSLR